MPSLKKFTRDEYPARSRQNQYSRYTRPIDADTLLAFRDSIRLAPVFIQKRIQKKAEYCLILISKHDFVCRIDATHINDPEVTLDWSVTEPDKLVQVPDKLPIDYLNKLYQMLDELGLNLGSISSATRMTPSTLSNSIQTDSGIGSKFSLKCLWFAQWWNSSKM